MVNSQSLVMAGEARVVAKRRNAENPPQRHRDHGDEPKFADEHGFDFILCALSVSVVKDSQEDQAESDLNYAKQSQFPEGRIGTKCCSGKGL
jgi:hypothetical protein